MSTSVKLPEQKPAQRRMKTSTRWIIGIVGFVLVAALAAVLGVISLIFPVERVVDGSPEPVVDPVVEAPIADGEWFAFVTAGEDETGAITLGVDLADMLTGHEAHDAAVDAGVISPDEDLPNDFFIKNDAKVLELMHFSDDAVIQVISADDVTARLDVTPEQLAALYNGTYVGGEVYGVAVGEPVPMNVTIEDGVITNAVAVYLP